MTEFVSNVFDVACPNPLKLQEISSLAIVAELWQREIRSHLKSGKLTRILMYKLRSGIEVEKVFPNMPRMIYNFLNKYVNRCGHSIATWLYHYSIRIFEIDYPDWNEVLSMFHDFALDWDGAIHEVRTAKRMLLCDRISIYVKFRIACSYCFEDDIKRIWSSVSSTMNLNRLSFTEFPQLYYWTCLLSDKPHMVPNIGETVFSQFYKSASMDYSSALYYWNRIPLESQSQKFIRDLLDNNPKLFSRFILPKLNEPKLVEFIARNVDRLIRTLLNGHEHEERDRLVLPTWMYIRNKIDKKTFVHLIKNLLVKEAFDIQPREQLIYQSEVSPWCEIWNSAAQILKQAVFDDILLKDSEYLFRPYDFPGASSRQTRLLMAVLSDASFQERSTFWSKNWPSLILGTCVEDLLEIMKLCFRNEEEIALFKENTLFKYENIRPYLTFVLERPERKYYFREVDRFLYFCNSDAQKIMEMKQRFLHDPNNGIPHGLPLSRNEESDFLYLRTRNR